MAPFERTNYMHPKLVLILQFTILQLKKAGGDIFIYRSESLGSDSWEFVQKIPDQDARSCVMNMHGDGTVYLHCRKTVCVSTNGPEGTYDCHHRLNINTSERKVGGSSTFRDDDDRLYFITSRKEKKVNGDRSVFIYRFKEDDWTQIYEDPVASWTYLHRESPQIVKNKHMYYLFTSRTAGWEDSITSYLVSDSLEKFSSLTQERDEKEVVMHPENTADIKSMGTQFGWIQKFDRDTWFFSGRRHPDEDPCNAGQEYGKHVITSFQFDNLGVPHVYWKESFDWQSRDYNPMEFEEHPVANYGPTCVDTTEWFYMENIDKWKKCPYVARKKTGWRCNVDGVADNCQKTCEVFYCNPAFCNKENDGHLKFCPH